MLLLSAEAEGGQTRQEKLLGYPKTRRFVVKSAEEKMIGWKTFKRPWVVITIGGRLYSFGSVALFIMPLADGMQFGAALLHKSAEMGTADVTIQNESSLMMNESHHHGKNLSHPHRNLPAVSLKNAHPRAAQFKFTITDKCNH